MALNILVVSDSHVTGGLVKLTCSTSGHETDMANFEGKALEMLGNKRYDMVLVDEAWKEGEQAGQDVARRLREADQNAKIYLLKSGLEEPEEGHDYVNGLMPRSQGWIAQLVGTD